MDAYTETAPRAVDVYMTKLTFGNVLLLSFLFTLGDSIRRKLSVDRPVKRITEAGGAVSVILTATEHHAVVEVKDTGCGMSPEVGAHIFEKFYQGDTSHSAQGNGLGLALVKRVVDIMQGEIGVESAIILSLIFIKGWEESPVAYAAYMLAFYTLTFICIFCAMIVPKRYNEIKKKIYSHPLGNKYMTDAAFRTHVSLYASFGINLLYVVVNILSFILSGAVLMILYQNRGFEYYGVLIYVMAAYTFYMTTHAIADLVKYRKYDSPVMTATKSIALSTALVSMLSLETVMFSQFGADMSLESKRWMIALTGAGVSIGVITMSVYMIVKSTKAIKEGNK